MIYQLMPQQRAALPVQIRETAARKINAGSPVVYLSPKGVTKIELVKHLLVFTNLKRAA